MKFLSGSEKPWKGLPVFFSAEQNVHTFLLLVYSIFLMVSQNFLQLCSTVTFLEIAL